MILWSSVERQVQTLKLFGHLIAIRSTSFVITAKHRTVTIVLHILNMNTCITEMLFAIIILHHRSSTASVSF